MQLDNNGKSIAMHWRDIRQGIGTFTIVSHRNKDFNSKLMRLLLFIFIFILTLASCKNNRNGIPAQEKTYSRPDSKSPSYSTNGNEESEEKYPDDTYCAEVEYHNPNTGTSSSYTLTIEVESNEIVKINFPNGGWMGSDLFSGAELEEDGTANFKSDKGYDYNITIIGNSRNCFTDNVPRAVQCSGETEDGDQCENMTDNGKGLCWQHQVQE